MPNDECSIQLDSYGSKRGIAEQGTLFHAKNGHGLITPAWYTRVLLDGARVVFPLGCDRPKAERLDRELRVHLRDGRTLTEARHWLRGALRKRGKHERRATAAASIVDPQNPTLGDIVRVHHEAYLEAQPSTVYRYECSLLGLVETATRFRAGLPALKRSGQRVDFDSYAAVLDLPVTFLDESLVADFKTARMRAVPRCSPLEKSRKVSTNTELRQARCMFSAEAQVAYRQAGLRLPNLESFLAAPRFTRVVQQPQLPCEAAVTGVFDGLPELVDDDPAVFVVVALGLWGLRRNEIAHAERSWFQLTAGPSIVTRLRNGFRTKNYCERTVPVPDWLYRLLSGEVGGRYLGMDVEVRARVLERAVRWLRCHGLQTARKPLHTLRTYYAAYQLAVEISPFKVKARLGHADLTTTYRYYAAEPLSDELAQLWSRAVCFPKATAAG